MNKNPHLRHQSERPLVLVRDWRGPAPVTLPSRRRRDAGTGRARAGAEGVRLDEARMHDARLDEVQPREQISELTADLQRLKAEYDNYRKRVRRDRLAIREIAVVNVLTGLLPVLDVAEEVRRQGDDHGAAAVLSGTLQDRLAALGLRTVGAAGEPFDPHTHEAITYYACGGAREAVCTEVLRHGYRVGDHLLRPAQVAVTGPDSAA
ncbi:nucleotide exchange factor GrpE [Streptomyces sp. NPDC058439]|uniref:nucleotide exchange factor GrpE n=1 Tax=Streptomyces sp. NPDC058439 TaxID=3346500 RepID=UPI00364D5212